MADDIEPDDAEAPDGKSASRKSDGVWPNQLPATPDLISDKHLPMDALNRGAGWYDQPPVRTAEEIVEVERARRILDLSDKSVDFSAMDAYRCLSKYLDRPLTVQMLMARGFSTMSQLNRAEEVCQEIMENRKVGREYSSEERLAACKILTTVADARRNFGEHLLNVSEKGSRKQEKQQRRNQPPVAIQVNVTTPATQPPSPRPITNGGVAADTAEK